MVVSIPLQHDHGVRTRLGLIFSAEERATDRMRVVVIEHEVRATAFTIQPPLDLRLILLERGSDRTLRRFPVGVGGRRGNIAFALQTLAQLVV